MKLHKYQERMVNHTIEHKRVGLFLEMGLGKTATVLHTIKDLPKPVLIVGPLRVVETVWEQEAVKWGMDLAFSRILGTATQRLDGIMADADVYLVNIENLAWLRYKCERNWKWKTIVFDESSLLKSPGAKRTRAALWASKRAKSVILLSGTPSPNSLLDLYAQVKLLDGGERLGRNMESYKRKYFYPTDYMRYNWEVKPGCDHEINEKISDICVSLIASDYLYLPEMIVNDIKVDIGDAMQGYNELVDAMHLELQDEEIEAESAAVLVNKLAQYASGSVYTEDGEWVEIHSAKLDRLTDIIEESVGKPILLVYSYKHTLERVMRRHTVATITQANVDLWNERRVPILAIHHAMGHGLNLAEGGSTIVWLDGCWSLEGWLQTNARLHRQGQADPVIVHRLMAEGTIDIAMAERIESKDSVQNLLLEAIKK